MHPSLAQVHDRIELQKSALPQMYGDVDFTQTPERYTQDVAEVHYRHRCTIWRRLQRIWLRGSRPIRCWGM